MTTIREWSGTSIDAQPGSSILVPLDGSPFGELALPFAARLASASHTGLLLASVTEPISEAPRAERQDYLGVVAQRVSCVGVSVQTIVLTGSLVAQTLVEEISRRSISLVVAAAHRRTRSGRWQHGSVTEPLITWATVPVLLIPEDSPECWPTDRILRMLVPLDGSPCSEAVLASARALATWTGAEILLLEVVDPAVNGLLIESPTVQLEHERAYVDRVVARLDSSGTEVRGRVELGRPAHTINRLAHTLHTDLIAMAIHGSGCTSRTVPGHVAAAVLDQADLPFLLVGNSR